jgi:CheY-like chemotaxis protein
MPRILVIDDSKFQRTFARLMLQEDGFEVAEAEDGRTGLEQLRSDQFDCVLLDLLMPGMSGLDVLRALQTDNNQVPVIVVTAEDQPSGREECLQLGAAGVIDKPRAGRELTTAIWAVLQGGP